MTFEELNELMKIHQIPRNVRLMSDSGWECEATDMNGIYYNWKENIIVFTQGGSYDDYSEDTQWKKIKQEVVIRGNLGGSRSLDVEEIYMIYAMSDIHGFYNLFIDRMRLIEPQLLKEDCKLILLGDFIDLGPDSFKCLQLAYSLQTKYGKDKVVVLRGNHEEWFIDFLKGQGDEWLAEDEGFKTSATFLSEKQKDELFKLTSRKERIQYIIDEIKASHSELLKWLYKLPYYYETATQIFVHAGVDEDIPEEEIDYCTLGTSEYIFTGKYPPTTGKFYKTIIAGHTAASSIAQDTNWKHIYFDKQSHYYIDGSVTQTNRLLCLLYDESTDQYYEITEDGSKRKI